MFARKQGSTLIPVYIGKADVLRRRLKQQLNNLRLMSGLEASPRARKFLVYAEYSGKPGPKASKAIATAERSLIEFALAQGYDLINQQGTRRPHHTIQHWGTRASREWLPGIMSAPKHR